MVLHLGSKIICAREVTWSVESVPSVPWTNTDAPSLLKEKVERNKSTKEQNASQGHTYPSGCQHVPWIPVTTLTMLRFFAGFFPSLPISPDALQNATIRFLPKPGVYYKKMKPINQFRRIKERKGRVWPPERQQHYCAEQGSLSKSQAQTVLTHQ